MGTAEYRFTQFATIISFPFYFSQNERFCSKCSSYSLSASSFGLDGVRCVNGYAWQLCREGSYLSLSPVSTGGRRTLGATVGLSCEAILDCDGPSAGGVNVLDFDCFHLFSPSL